MTEEERASAIPLPTDQREIKNGVLYKHSTPTATVYVTLENFSPQVVGEYTRQMVRCARRFENERSKTL